MFLCLLWRWRSNGAEYQAYQEQRPRQSDSYVLQSRFHLRPCCCSFIEGWAATRNASGRSSWHRWRSSSDVTPVACASELGFVAGTSDLLLRNDLLNSELHRTLVHRLEYGQRQFYLMPTSDRDEPPSGWTCFCSIFPVSDKDYCNNLSSCCSLHNLEVLYIP